MECIYWDSRGRYQTIALIHGLSPTALHAADITGDRENIFRAIEGEREGRGAAT